MKCNIYLNGVGGQGIGVLSELVLRAYDHAGFDVKAVDTHGLAQRGGSVESHIRVGAPSGSPLIEKGRADVVISLERTEAFRAVHSMLADGGRIAYFDTVWQSLSVRLGKEDSPTAAGLADAAEMKHAAVLRVSDPQLEDVRMQNIRLIADAVKSEFIPGIGMDNIRYALGVLFSGDALEINMRLLEAV